jgi:C-methyltransferase
MAKSRANRASPSRPYEVLFQMVIGKWISQALGTVVEIGVPEQLAKGARRCSDIAREAGVSEDGIYRLLRALASVGLFVESGDRRFKLTGMGKLLRRDHPESLAGYARFVAHDSTWRPWGQLGYSVKTGMPAFDHVFNVPIFERLSQHPEVAAVFDDAMTSISATEARATSDAYDFKGVATLMDVAMKHRDVPSWFLRIIGIVCPSVSSSCFRMPMQIEYFNDSFPYCPTFERPFHWHTFNVA